MNKFRSKTMPNRKIKFFFVISKISFRYTKMKFENKRRRHIKKYFIVCKKIKTHSSVCCVLPLWFYSLSMLFSILHFTFYFISARFYFSCRYSILKNLKLCDFQTWNVYEGRLCTDKFFDESLLWHFFFFLFWSNNKECQNEILSSYRYGTENPFVCYGIYFHQWIIIFDIIFLNLEMQWNRSALCSLFLFFTSATFLCTSYFLSANSMLISIWSTLQTLSRFH